MIFPGGLRRLVFISEMLPKLILFFTDLLPIFIFFSFLIYYRNITDTYFFSFFLNIICKKSYPFIYYQFVIDLLPIFIFFFFFNLLPKYH
jgi:hypothetical protein